ncbi:VOC family protein [Niveispirillum sp. SYP-B3756]|uniref:VOC family protein n=1 Tax=Niveispirillum sp. SYP-B3756 TaxID=2662178 RepID=UPI001290E420|nr:VOC family protein [Niveispirillum sp. SYP-B3756]MQP64110.1 VOC family protein [Niveispirillum sp. SYP-B3756]
MRLFRVTLPVASVESAARFYGTVLAQAGTRVAPDRHSFEVGQVRLDCRQVAGGMPIPLSEPVCFAVHDLKEFRQRVLAAGSDTPSDIIVEPSGERSFHCTDPSGNALCFVEAGTERTN